MPDLLLLFIIIHSIISYFFLHAGISKYKSIIRYYQLLVFLGPHILKLQILTMHIQKKRVKYERDLSVYK
jgi:hypothetical protein